MALAVLWGAGTMSAQRGGKQRMSTENRVARMTKQLNLTEEQQQKITAIYKDFESKRKEGERPNREKMMEERKRWMNKSTACSPTSKRRNMRSWNRLEWKDNQEPDSIKKKNNKIIMYPLTDQIISGYNPHSIYYYTLQLFFVIIWHLIVLLLRHILLRYQIH